MILYMYRIFLEDEVMTEFQQFVGLFETREKKQFFVDEQNTLWRSEERRVGKECLE